MALRAVTSNGVAITPSSLTVSGTLTGSSGTATAASISPTINQSDTAGYTAFDVNPTETSTGSGANLLQRWAVGGTTRAQIDNSGGMFVAGFASTGLIGFASSIGGTADVTLFRDAAYTLAQRNGINAQTFRVYNTYTDGSNYERGFFDWVLGSNEFTIGTQHAGTGIGRQMNFATAGTRRWSILSTGHMVAYVDNTYDIGASGATRPRNLYMASWIRMATTTVAALPAAATAAAGARMFVTDANATTFASVVAGGGANIVPVYSDGTNWRIG